VDWERNVDPDFVSNRQLIPYETAESVAAADPGYVVQGHGTMGGHQAAAATVIRFGALTRDEFFVTEDAARGGVRVANLSDTEPLVVLKHFGPGNSSLT
jgi:hypothetical protein